MATKKNVNWEKIGIYVTLLTGFWMIVGHIDLKERASKLEVKVEHLQKEMNK
jgi:predicted amino acid dehydrogenase